MNGKRRSPKPFGLDGPSSQRRIYGKPALTYEEQLELLESRGMDVEDRDRALDALRRISYYRLSAYWHSFKRADNSFGPGTKFETASLLYDFDRRLRLVVLDGVEQVEVLVRSRLVYTLAHAYGPFAHAHPRNFVPSRNRLNYEAWYRGVEEDVSRS